MNFNTSKASRWKTDPRRCQINWVILDSDWEAEFCRVAESHPLVTAYVKNHSLGVVVQFESPKSETISSAVQIWSVTPAAIAGVLR